MIRQLALAMSLLLCGCWPTHKPNTDSRSNWLGACEKTADCDDGASCVDGQCVLEPSTEPLDTPEDAGAADAALLQSDASAVEEPALMHSILWESPGKSCATGGVRARSGVDRNRNGELEDGELQEAMLTCNETRTTDGRCVAPGAGASPGLVVCTTGEFAGHCEGSGIRIDHGHDPNLDGVLDDGEVERTGYACVPATDCTGDSWEVHAPSLVCCELAGIDVAEADWVGVDLSDSDLEDANLTAADLSRSCPSCQATRINCANLSRTVLTGANLSGASIGGTNLNAARLDDAIAEDAQFEGADLTDAVLDNARLRRAKFSYADLIGVSLRGADLRDADLNHANLRGSDLTSARLAGAATASLQACPASMPDSSWVCVSGALPICGQESSAPMFALIGPKADLRAVNLTGRTLAGIDLSGANLTGAELAGTDLRGADLSDTTLTGADLRGAVLESAEMARAITTSTLTDSSTVCPGGVRGPCW